MFLGTFDVLRLKLIACNHDFILKEIKFHIKEKKNFLISPIASQTFVLAYYDKELRDILNKFDYLFSDSLWVKRSVNFLYNIGLKDRLRGSNFLLQVSSLAQKYRYRVYLYGTTSETLERLKARLFDLYPKIKIVGSAPSVFRPLTPLEKKNLIKEIEEKKTDILFLALGSPLEQVFSYEILYRKPSFSKPMIVIPFGAAFDFISGVKPTAPKWMQEIGIEWFFRLLCEPRRLWKRYLIYGTIFVELVFRQKIEVIFKK